MRKIWLFAIPCLAFAQLDDNTVTVTATRQLNVQADQVLIGATVSAASTATLDDVVAALAGTGITAANLSSVYTYSSQTPPSQWYFSLPVSFAQLKDTLASLAGAQQNAAKNSTAMQIYYYVQGTQVSAQLLAANPCVFTALVGDAQAQTQKVAGAVGLKVGSILAIWDSSSGGSAIIKAGDFSQSIAVFEPSTVTAFISPNLYTPPPTCTMTVQFQLLH
ncbi:MAG TPA: SIMPL domain-containing protein [Bryobacteraceae bacterium]|nr:SIMPL domain-containing protein [Bryobacteraceae bacterium]